jgi:hypothetical protein
VFGTKRHRKGCALHSCVRSRLEKAGTADTLSCKRIRPAQALQDTFDRSYAVVPILQLRICLYDFSNANLSACPERPAPESMKIFIVAALVSILPAVLELLAGALFPDGILPKSRKALRPH